MALLREFLLPLLAGYTFLLLSNTTKFRLRSLSGYHLLLWCAYAVPAAILLERVFPEQDSWREGFVGLDVLVLAALLALSSNVFVRRNQAVKRAALAGAHAEMHKFLNHAVQHHDLTEISLKSGKCYIGIPMMTIPGDGAALEHIRILPFLSGYRDESQELVVSSDYEWLYAPEAKADVEAESSDEALFRPYEDYEILLPVSEILIMRLFDPLFYSRPKGARRVRTLRYNKGLPYERPDGVSSAGSAQHAS